MLTESVLVNVDVVDGLVDGDVVRVLELAATDIDDVFDTLIDGLDDTE